MGFAARHPSPTAEFVAQLARSFELPFHLRQANVPAIDGNLEEAARNVRQAFYAELIASGAVDRVATGHTRSDQAETVLYRILRGSGLTGLSGILPVTREGLVRPLLEIDRSEIEAWLRERDIAWREDQTNQDRTYARNRLRHEILPLLREDFNPQLDAALANLATLARDEEAYWDSELCQPTPNPQPPTPGARRHRARQRSTRARSQTSPASRRIGGKGDTVPSISPTWSECSKWRGPRTVTTASRRRAWTSADPSI